MPLTPPLQENQEKVKIVLRALNLI